MDISVITVTWNNKENITEQIRSVVLACEGIEYEQFVVDNGSTDGTADLVEHVFPNVKLIRNKNNLGFAAANNQAAKIASGEFYLFLNPDMKIVSGKLIEMVHYMRDNDNVGLIGCQLMANNGKLPVAGDGPRRFPKTWEQIAIIMKLPHLFPRLMDSYYYKGLDPNIVQYVDTVRGSFIFIKRNIIDELGWAFDPRYYIWYEDVDLCREVKRLGYRVVYNPLITCVDYVGQGFKQQDFLNKQKRLLNSMLAYFQKWESWHKWIWIWLFRWVGIGLAKCYTLLK